jgi:hypothetical protein
MQVNFFYKNLNSLPKSEIIIKNICTHATDILELPNTIDICLYKLAKSTYGGIDRKKINRLVLNYDLPVKQIPLILTHELIHINQRYTGVLEITKDGWHIWQKNFYLKADPESLPYEQYSKLPWEVDVQCRLSTILKKILDKALTMW